VEAFTDPQDPSRNVAFASLAQSVAPRDTAASPRLWAIAGGKGGVGKSIVASNLAIAFAAQRQRCVLVDGDLGGANLHTLVGVTRPRLTLSMFLSGEVANLGEVAASTSIPRLSLIGGGEALRDMANPSHALKQKLLRHLRGLDADHVILDLGAGSSFNVLDLFLAAERRILVIDPEPTSIDNAYHFLKASFLRSLRAVARRPEVCVHLEQVLAERRGILSPRELIAAVSDLDTSAGKLLAERAAAFEPMLIVNQVRRSEDLELGREIRTAAREHLGAEIDYLGSLAWDALVMDAVRRRQPVRQLFPGSTFCEGLDAIADRLLDPSAPRPQRSAADSPLHLVAVREDGSHLPTLDLDDPPGTLRRCREHLRLSLAQVHQHTRIPCLANLEAGRFEALPPEPYVRGFVLLYARTLGIPDPATLAQRYLEHCKTSLPA
jgi:flagellar biosynthesis protein FlhG